MDKNKEKTAKRGRRRGRIRARICGTESCPRLSVFKSNKEIYLQIIDDGKGETLASAHGREIGDGKEAGEHGRYFSLGKLIAQRAKDKKISRVVFDRGGYRYHGHIKEAAEGAREGGLEF